MRTLIKIFLINILFINFFLLFGCGGVKEKIGLIKKPPDEFQVYKNKPLSVPPTFELRAPVKSDIAIDQNEDERIIFNEEDNIDEKLSLSDEVLLIAIGEKESEKNIRQIINEENSIQEVDKSILDKILDFERVFEVKKNEEDTISAKEEKERIEKLVEEGKIIKVENQAIIIEKEGSLD